MNGVAVIAYSVPVAAFALGAAAVMLHRRALRRALSPAQQAELQRAELAEAEAQLAALERRIEERRARSARLRAELSAVMAEERSQRDDGGGPRAGQAATAR